MPADPKTTNDPDFSRIARGLMKAIQTPTDDLAARRGEGDLMVQIKRNSDRVKGCLGHEFVPAPDWRSGSLYNLRVACSVCGGELKAHDVLTYLSGFAHGSGQDYKTISDRIFPPGDVSP